MSAYTLCMATRTDREQTWEDGVLVSDVEVVLEIIPTIEERIAALEAEVVALKVAAPTGL